MAQNDSKKVFTAAMAVIKIDNKTCGYMRSLTFTENVQRGEVKGISSLALQEVPAIGIMCSFSADFFFISLARPELRAMFMRDQGKDVLVNTLILGEKGITIDVYKKGAIKWDSTGKVVLGIDPEKEVVASIRDAFVNSQNVNISDSQISGSSINGIYLNPVFSDI